MSFNPLGTLTRNIGYGTGWSFFPTVSPDTASAFIFDLRVMDKAVSESGGSAANSSNLGAISYVFDDFKNNNGKVTLPFG